MDASCDRCPYSRSLAPAFRGCAAFVPTLYRTLDFKYRPTTPVLSCAHLVVGQQPGVKHFYPRCAIGDEAARRHWVESLTEAVLEQLRTLGADYRLWVAPRMGPLWELKAAYLAARAGGDARSVEERRQALTAAVDGLLAEAEEFFRKRTDLLHSLELSVEAMMGLVRVATEHWALADHSAGAHYEIPEEVLGRFPPRVRLFVTAGRQLPADPPLAAG
jgi:hypothetical protein